jgi:hypothetical protein
MLIPVSVLSIFALTLAAALAAKYPETVTCTTNSDKSIQTCHRMPLAHTTVAHNPGTTLMTVKRDAKLGGFTWPTRTYVDTSTRMNTSTSVKMSTRVDTSTRLVTSTSTKRTGNYSQSKTGACTQTTTVTETKTVTQPRTVTETTTATGHSKA